MRNLNFFSPEGECDFDDCAQPAAVWVRYQDKLVKLCVDHVRLRETHAERVEKEQLDLAEPPGGYSDGRSAPAWTSSEWGGARTPVEHIHGDPSKWRDVE